jgi:hypothetical protein
MHSIDKSKPERKFIRQRASRNKMRLSLAIVLSFKSQNAFGDLVKPLSDRG